MSTKPIEVKPELVAACGLYCAACGKYLKGKCPGCWKNEKASWCKVRSCCMENEYGSCADCTEHADPNSCGKFNNFFSRVFALIFNSNRGACIAKIREGGPDAYAKFMTDQGRMSLPRK